MKGDQPLACNVQPGMIVKGTYYGASKSCVGVVVAVKRAKDIFPRAKDTFPHVELIDFKDGIDVLSEDGIRYFDLEEDKVEIVDESS